MFFCPSIRERGQLNSYLRSVPYSDPMDTEYRRVVYVRYADDFLIGVIGSKEDARQVKSDVGTFIREHLHLEMSPEKTLITHGNDFAYFLGYLITISREQNSTRTKTGFTRRTYVGKVKLYVPKEKWLNHLLSYGALKISYDKAHGNKEVWEPVRRPGLIRLDDIEILNQYNAEVRGMYNYYRLANNATVLNAFLYVMKFSMYKTFAGKYRTSMRKIIRKYCHNEDFTVSYQTKNGMKSVVFYNQGMRHNDKITVTENPDIIGRANENRRYTRLTDRLQGHICEFCGAETEDIEIHHVRKLKDLSGKAEWERHMIARKRKTMALCHSCHVTDDCEHKESCFHYRSKSELFPCCALSGRKRRSRDPKEQCPAVCAVGIQPGRAGTACGRRGYSGRIQATDRQEPPRL